MEKEIIKNIARNLNCEDINSNKELSEKINSELDPSLHISPHQIGNWKNPNKSTSKSIVALLAYIECLLLKIKKGN